jgi:hypothetical protein
VAFARTLYHRDRCGLFLFDDPFASVDVHVGKMMFDRGIAKHLKGRTRIVVVSSQTELLKSADIDADVTTPNGHTALMMASMNGNHRVVPLLLAETRSDPNIQDGKNLTALMWGAMKGQTRVVEALLADWEVDPNVKDGRGLSALSRCMVQACGDGVVDALLRSERVDVNSRNLGRATPLFLAAYHNRLSYVEKLLAAKGLDPHAVAADGSTPTRVAKASGHKAVELAIAKAFPEVYVRTDGILAKAAEERAAREAKKGGEGGSGEGGRKRGPEPPTHTPPGHTGTGAGGGEQHHFSTSDIKITTESPPGSSSGSASLRMPGPAEPPSRQPTASPTARPSAPPTAAAPKGKQAKQRAPPYTAEMKGEATVGMRDSGSGVAENAGLADVHIKNPPNVGSAPRASTGGATVYIAGQPEGIHATVEGGEGGGDGGGGADGGGSSDEVRLGQEEDQDEL